MRIAAVAALVALTGCRSRAQPEAAPQVTPLPKKVLPMVTATATYPAVAAASAPWFQVQRRTDVIFRDGHGALAAFDLAQATFSPLRALPAGFETATLMGLSDGRLLAFADAAPPRAVLGDGLGAWIPIAPPPTRATSWGLGSLPDGRALLVGGYTGDVKAGSTETWLYAPATGGWTAGPALPEGSWFGAAVWARDRLVVIANLPNPQRPRAFVLDPTATTWTLTHAERVQNGFASVPLADGRVAVVGGGSVGETDDAPATLVFDPTSRRFTRFAPLPEAQGNPAATELAPGVLAVFSGDASTYDGHLDQHVMTLALGDPAARWQPGATLPTGLRAHHVARAGDRVFVFCHRGTAPTDVTVLDASPAAIRGH